jgi:hypothetical protein
MKGHVTVGKYRVNETPSVSSGDLLPDVRLTSGDVRSDVTTKVWMTLMLCVTSNTCYWLTALGRTEVLETLSSRSASSLRTRLTQSRPQASRLTRWLGLTGGDVFVYYESRKRELNVFKNTIVVYYESQS